MSRQLSTCRSLEVASMQVLSVIAHRLSSALKTF